MLFSMALGTAFFLTVPPPLPPWHWAGEDAEDQLVQGLKVKHNSESELTDRAWGLDWPRGQIPASELGPGLQVGPMRAQGDTGKDWPQPERPGSPGLVLSQHIPEAGRLGR